MSSIALYWSSPTLGTSALLTSFNGRLTCASRARTRPQGLPPEENGLIPEVRPALAWVLLRFRVRGV